MRYLCHGTLPPFAIRPPWEFGQRKLMLAVLSSSGGAILRDLESEERQSLLSFDLDMAKRLPLTTRGSCGPMLTLCRTGIVQRVAGSTFLAPKEW